MQNPYGSVKENPGHFVEAAKGVHKDGANAAPEEMGGEAALAQMSLDASTLTPSLVAGAAAVEREMILPTDPELRSAWGDVSVDFARRCSLPLFDETDDEAMADGLAFAAAKDKAAAAVNDGKKKNKFKRRPMSGRAGAGKGGRSPPDSAAPDCGPRESVPPTSWTPISGSKFNVRAGANYKKTGLKAPSQDSLYETVAVRCFRSDQRTRGLVDALPLPLQEAFGPDRNIDRGDRKGRLPYTGESKHGLFVPDMLVVHFQLPYEGPNVFKPKDDGQGGEVSAAFSRVI